MITTYSLSLFFHLAGFAVFVGSAIAQSRVLGASGAAGMAAGARDACEQLGAAITTKMQLPAIFVSLISGVGLLMMKPGQMQNPAMHVKLTIVLLLLILSHLEMFNARRIVKARKSGGEGAETEIAARKKRHRMFSTIGAIGVLGIVGLVAFGIRG